MPRVLLIDDDEDQLAIREMILQAHGHEVRTASTAEAAFALACIWPPHVIVMDLRLPTAVEGRALIHQLPAPERVIVLTGDSTARLRALPVFRVLEKPCPSRVLADAITAAAAQNGDVS